MDWESIIKRDEGDYCFLKTASIRNKRTAIYLKFSISEDFKQLLTTTGNEMKKFFAKYSLKYQQVEDFDIIEALSDPSWYDELGENTSENLIEHTKIKATVCDCRPLFPFLNIDQEALERKDLRTPPSNLKRIGFQTILNLTEDEEESDTGSSSSCSSEFEEPDKKKRKTCQKAEVVCEDTLGLFEGHRHNSEDIKGTTVHVDLLIFLPNPEICAVLTKLLGMIFIDKILLLSNEHEIEERIRDKEVKIYRLLQTLINRELMHGCHNICLTNSPYLFENIKANFKSVIITNERNFMVYYGLIELANHKVYILENSNYLPYISAITEIVNEALLCEASVPAVFKLFGHEKEELYKINLSLISVVPFYVLRYIAQEKIVSKYSKEKLDLL